MRFLSGTRSHEIIEAEGGVGEAAVEASTLS